jgi:ribosome-associated translation inhibitor RaiA
MRIDVHAVNIELPPALRRYAETRAWKAGRRHASRTTWLCVTVANQTAASGVPAVSCRIDGWLRGIGNVSVRHVGADPYVAIDRAAVRLEQAIGRRVGQPAGAPSLAGSERDHLTFGPPDDGIHRRPTNASVRRKTLVSLGV